MQVDHWKQSGTFNGLPMFVSDKATPEDRQKILGLTPQADALALAGNLARERGKFLTAVMCFKRATNICPHNAYLLCGYGAALWFAGKFARAHTVLAKALAINPIDPMANCNMGTVLSSLGDIKAASWYFEKALKSEPGNDTIKWNFAMALLDHGKWDQAWPLYEIRSSYLGSGDNKFPKLPYPMWKGEDLTGKTIYVHAEQGFGDRILFTRYLSWIHDKWPSAKIIMLPTTPPMPDMRPLLWEFRGFVDFLPAGVPWPQADYGVFLMSLPGIAGDQPDEVYPDPGLIRKRVARDAESVKLPEPMFPGLKVGICWSGNPLMMRNDERSMPFELILELAELPGVCLYGLQFGQAAGDIERFGANELVCDLSDDINAHGGFVGTGAVMMKLDLVITICTANAHLAGVLGVPCWTMLCADPYWLWLRRKRDCVWYPNTRLFRQPKPGDWRSVIDEVKSELATLIRNRSIQTDATAA